MTYHTWYRKSHCYILQRNTVGIYNSLICILAARVYLYYLAMELLPPKFSSTEVGLLILKELQLMRKEVVSVMLRVETKLNVLDDFKNYFENTQPNANELLVPKTENNEKPNMFKNYLPEDLPVGSEMAEEVVTNMTQNIAVDCNEVPFSEINEVCIDVDDNSDQFLDDADKVPRANVFKVENDLDNNHSHFKRLFHHAVQESNVADPFTTFKARKSSLTQPPNVELPMMLSDVENTGTSTGIKKFTRSLMPYHKSLAPVDTGHLCKYCLKQYASKKTLNRHIRSHTNDRRYHCHLCPKRFLRKEHLVYHLKSMHKEPPTEPTTSEASDNYAVPSMPVVLNLGGTLPEKDVGKFEGDCEPEKAKHG